MFLASVRAADYEDIAIYSAERLRLILGRALSEIEMLEFPLGCPVKGRDLEELTDILKEFSVIREDWQTLVRARAASRALEDFS